MTDGEAVQKGWVQYDPDQHGEEPLYTTVGVHLGKITAIVIVRADVVIEEAVMVPWRFLVWNSLGEPKGVVPRSVIA